jgi:hypothetical protein
VHFKHRSTTKAREVFQCLANKLLITLWMVHCVNTPTVVTIKMQMSFLTQLPERKENAQGFPHEANGNFKTVTEFNGCDRKNDGSTTL